MGAQRSHVLEPEFLIGAYASGYFPMADSNTGEIQWYSPDPRAILELNGLRISRSLRQRLRSGRFSVRWDTAFARVVRACSARKETWISDEIIQAYERLHALGFAHSVETWLGEDLVGGLYGVALEKAFFGESMFSIQTDASKVALAGLVERLTTFGFELLDVQFQTPHLKSLGVIEIPRKEYLRRLQKAVPVVGRAPTMSNESGV